MSEKSSTLDGLFEATEKHKPTIYKCDA